jgi:hypothetical protein
VKSNNLYFISSVVRIFLTLPQVFSTRLVYRLMLPSAMLCFRNLMDNNFFISSVVRISIKQCRIFCNVSSSYFFAAQCHAVIP